MSDATQTPQTIGHMTYTELRDFIWTTIREQQPPEVPRFYQIGDPSPAALQKILAGFLEYSDGPSVVELLRADRDR